MRSLAEGRNGCLIAIEVSRRWSSGKGNHKFSVIARLDRAIQYSEASVIPREAAAYWIPRFRGE